MAINVIVKSFIQGFSGGIRHTLGYNRVHLYKQENRYNIFLELSLSVCLCFVLSKNVFSLKNYCSCRTLKLETVIYEVQQTLK